MMRLGIRLPSNRPCAAATWLAIFALLSQTLAPAALITASGVLAPGVASIRSTLCTASPERDSPGKTKPALPVHYCALCTVSTADLYRPPTGFTPNIEIAPTVYPLSGKERPVLRLRHGQMQARAPPVMA